MKRLIYLLAMLSLSSLITAQVLTFSEGSKTYDSLADYTINMSGQCELHLNGDAPIAGAQFNLTGDDAWVYFHGVRPSYVIARLSQFNIDGATAVDDVNVRVHQYEMGAVLIPHTDDYAGAVLYADANLSGDALNLKHFVFYKDEAGLGALNNAVSSFVLKKGYMLTIAQENNGMGYSKNYVADKEDMVVNQLPVSLDNEVSFARVVRWNWATKKGINNVTTGALVDASWFYNWGSSSQSSDDMEFVPMKWGGGNVTEKNFHGKLNITHQLAFNEPSHEEQSNMSVDAALREYPKLLATGLRAGSPNIADNGKPWLYEFMEKADELNYRIDFVGVHWYKGCQSAQQFYNWIKDVHVRTGRPIWITEWNNGADWTAASCEPTYQEQADKIATFLHMFDTCSFVERYCIYNWGKETRKLAPNNGEDGTLYLSGEVYRDQLSPFAYNADAYYTPIYKAITPPFSITTKTTEMSVALTWYENAYQEDGFSIERSHDGGAYVEIGKVNGEQNYKVTYTDSEITDYGEYTYRIRTVKDGAYSIYSDEVKTTIDDGVYDIVYIKHRESGKLLRSLGTSLDMADATETGTDVQWFVSPADDGYSFVESVKDRLRLYNGADYPTLIDNKWTGGNVQWELKEAEDDYYYMTNKSRGERLFSKSDNLTVTFVPTSYAGTKVQWQLVDTGADFGDNTALGDVESEQQYTLSPNPCDQILTIEGLDKLTNITVFDVAGRILLQVKSQRNIEVSALKQGLYLLQVGNAPVMRFIKR